MISASKLVGAEAFTYISIASSLRLTSPWETILALSCGGFLLLCSLDRNSPLFFQKFGWKMVICMGTDWIPVKVETSFRSTRRALQFCSGNSMMAVDSGCKWQTKKWLCRLGVTNHISEVISLLTTGRSPLCGILQVFQYIPSFSSFHHHFCLSCSRHVLRLAGSIGALAITRSARKPRRSSVVDTGDASETPVRNIIGPASSCIHTKVESPHHEENGIIMNYWILDDIDHETFLGSQIPKNAFIFARATFCGG